MKTLKICLVILCPLSFWTVEKPQFDGATFFMETEIWKDVVGYEGMYQVSNHGRVKSLRSKKEIVMKQNIHYKNGYVSILFKQGKNQKRLTVHSLVANHFIEKTDC